MNSETCTRSLKPDRFFPRRRWKSPEGSVPPKPQTPQDIRVGSGSAPAATKTSTFRGLHQAADGAFAAGARLGTFAARPDHRTLSGRANSFKLLICANLLAATWCARSAYQNIGARKFARAFKYYYANFLISFLSFKLHSLPKG